MNNLRKRIRDRLARRWLGGERPPYAPPADPAVLDMLADLIVARLFRPGMDANIVRLFIRPGAPDDEPPSEWAELAAVVVPQLSERTRFAKGREAEAMDIEMGELAERIAGRIDGVALVDEKMGAAVRRLIDIWAERDQAAQVGGLGR